MGYNVLGLWGFVNIFIVLNELGFVYYIDDVSWDEFFIVNFNNGKFIMVVFYVVYLNDICVYEVCFFFFG